MVKSYNLFNYIFNLVNIYLFIQEHKYISLHFPYSLTHLGENWHIWSHIMLFSNSEFCENLSRKAILYWHAQNNFTHTSYIFHPIFFFWGGDDKGTVHKKLLCDHEFCEYQCNKSYLLFTGISDVLRALSAFIYWLW